MKGLIKIVKSLEDFSFLIENVTRTIENETKRKMNGFLGMLLHTVDANIFNFFIR